MKNKYVAEFVGTFALAFVVLSAVSQVTPLPFAIPVMAGLVLGLFVYTIGSISGCHINPAVTLGLLSIKKISNNEALGYIIAQIFAGAVAIVVARMSGMVSPESVSMVFDKQVFMAEILGAFFFAFGIAAVVYGKVSNHLSGVVIGGSLLIGTLVASFVGSAGILNPAVAFALNSISLTYVLGPIIGSVLGFRIYKMLLS